MGFLARLLKPLNRAASNTDTRLPGEIQRGSSERGVRSTAESTVRNLHRTMWVDPDICAAILEIRHMDRIDGRVKKIHRMCARAAVKGGLVLEAPSSEKRLHREFGTFVQRLGLSRREKLESDARGLVMEGNLPLQWVLDQDRQVAAAVRMPTETILPKVSAGGQIENPAEAYLQVDPLGHHPIATFALWQLTLCRLDPENYDDWGCYGRPYLDANRTVWKKLNMTEEDLVIRRRMRAPLRMNHVLEGASDSELSTYRQGVEADQEHGNFRDYFMNKKGSVSAVQGDANLDQIADVAHLLDSFFAGAPAPRGVFGYTEGLNRDILEDLKRDFFDELDAIQDTAAFGYEVGFRLHLLLNGINPDRFKFDVRYAERRTETRNQRADLALKYQALGTARETAWRTAGLDPATVRAELENERDEFDPYPTEPVSNSVTVTPGNARKGESATDVSTTRPSR